MTNGNAFPDVIVGRGLREKTVVSGGQWGGMREEKNDNGHEGKGTEDERRRGEGGREGGGKGGGSD